MTESVRYEDVPSAIVFEGHLGITEMCAGAFQMSSDLTIEIVTRQTNGGRRWLGVALRDSQQSARWQHLLDAPGPPRLMSTTVGVGPRIQGVRHVGTTHHESTEAWPGR